MTLLSRVCRGRSVCTEDASKTAAGNNNTGKTSGTITGAGVLAVMVMLSAEAAAVGMDDGARMASVDATDAEAADSKINPSTRRGTSC